MIERRRSILARSENNSQSTTAATASSLDVTDMKRFPNPIQFHSLSWNTAFEYMVVRLSRQNDNSGSCLLSLMTLSRLVREYICEWNPSSASFVSIVEPLRRPTGTSSESVLPRLNRRKQPSGLIRSRSLLMHLRSNLTVYSPNTVNSEARGALKQSQCVHGECSR